MSSKKEFNMNYFETNIEEISRSIQLLAQIFEYRYLNLQWKKRMKIEQDMFHI